MRKNPRWILAPALGAALWAGVLSAGTPLLTPTVEKFKEEVYLTLPEALEQIFGKGASISKDEFILGMEPRMVLEKRLGRRVAEAGFTVHRGTRDGKTLGEAVVTEETGLFKKITFIVHIRPDGKVGRAAVLTYREPRGMEVRHRRFLKQYEGKSAGDPISLNRDIVNITGATLSSRALSAGVKKVLHFIVDVYRPALDKTQRKRT